MARLGGAGLGEALCLAKNTSSVLDPYTQWPVGITPWMHSEHYHYKSVRDCPSHPFCSSGAQWRCGCKDVNCEKRSGAYVSRQGTMEDTGLGPLVKATFKMVRGSEQYLVKVDK